jgi:hypothetical protein
VADGDADAGDVARVDVAADVIVAHCAAFFIKGQILFVDLRYK